MKQSPCERSCGRTRRAWRTRTGGAARASASAIALAAALVPCAACAPLVDVAGAFFPSWMLCILIGIGATVLLREVLARTRLESSLGPLLIVYPSLAAAISLFLWVVLYRRP
jgi:YtcA family